jgi:bifunctional non-homologous end joining protein LigD
MALAQIGVLEIHPWGSCAEHLEQPDRLIFDLDPGESISWEVLADAALDVRRRLKGQGLDSWVKTTGGKGLHVVVPMKPRMEWPEAKRWCHHFAIGMERDNPGLYLTKMSKAARHGKIYLDYLRNERGATAVAPYSPRARRGVNVALPLAWEELSDPQRPVFRAVDFANWSARLRRDVWVGFFKSKQGLPG